MSNRETLPAEASARQSTPRITLRISRDALSFAQADGSAPSGISFETFPVRSGVSIAANLRDAFTSCELLSRATPESRAQVLLDAPVMLVPIEEFRQHQADLLFRHTFTGHEGDQVMWAALPSFNVVALFAVNKDLRLVVEDHFADIRWSHVCLPVWTHLHRRSASGLRRRLFAYFHDRSMELFSFQQHRFRYQNTFEQGHVADTVYFVLNVWKQLGFDQKADELHLIGEIPQHDALRDELHQYVQNVYAVGVAADFNRDAVTRVEGFSYDLMAAFEGKRGDLLSDK